MKIAVGADHAGYERKNEIAEHLRSKGIEVLDFGTNSPDSVDYPDFAFATAQAVSEGKADLGILVCGSGIGVNITANKVSGIRAANCLTSEMAELARGHNNANILTLGARLTSKEIALEITDTFLSAPFQNGRHAGRVEKIHALTSC